MFGHGGEKSRSRTASFHINRASQHWWAWIAVGEVENLAGQVIRALLSGAEGICFSSLPTEDNPLECERLKAIGFLAVHLRLWKPLLSERPNFSEAWEWKTEEVSGWVWSLEGEETLCLFSPLTFSPTLWLKFPFVVREGVRAYSVQFPALVRLPLQRKGNNTFVKFSEPKVDQHGLADKQHGAGSKDAPCR
jgi:hypothetical protein